MRYYAKLAALLSLLLFALGTSAETDTEQPLWIDVRSAAEWNQGHLEQAHLIPWDGIEAGIQGVTDDKDQPIYLYCRSGGRAGKAKQRLEALGYTRVTNVGSLEAARELAKNL